MIFWGFHEKGHCVNFCCCLFSPREDAILYNESFYIFPDVNHDNPMLTGMFAICFTLISMHFLTIVAVACLH